MVGGRVGWVGVEWRCGGVRVGLWWGVEWGGWG